MWRAGPSVMFLGIGGFASLFLFFLFGLAGLRLISYVRVAKPLIIV
jgi:hypothetical protein